LDSSSDQLAKEKLIPCCDEDEADTDLETDRLLGQQRLEENSMGESKVRPAFLLDLRPLILRCTLHFQIIRPNKAFVSRFFFIFTLSIRFLSFSSHTSSNFCIDAQACTYPAFGHIGTTITIASQ
jgi:hypothetical protein